ncbi:hypothetical protein GH714_031769 [Hevea brasiliensis]|uniref:Protein kinase domain-containing protein n=1 Tax=Hevea brasiliensis TaxID=3981 RepID=A0A6A6LH99_HEVBR|nr:hypothetical protein GH714_031769 [Hevea brasiliensis]
MGCVSSKRTLSVADASPVLDYSYAPPPLAGNGHSSVGSSKCPSGYLNFEQKHKKDKKDGSRRKKSSYDIDNNNEEEVKEDRNTNLHGKKVKRRSSSGKSGPINLKLGFSHRHVGAEQIAAGWPSWLSSAAEEAIHGWLPLRADAFEKLEKIGQGTYSSVFRAREVETGRMVALKKVRFDNFQPESIRFMAREILILRRLDHPNIIKLEGIITSRLSSSIYLVFEYMEHDLAGLSSSPDIKFSDSQVKCYMKQLLHGIEHCHLRGIMHRDIKVSNILVNNEGILKLGDFGLANVLNSKNKNLLTSRVVTLWYRPPELLMGSTSYGVSVDLWSVGCVFAELLIGKPLLKGRTEVEQLHKIFKLCGSPSDEYWKQSKLPNATMFKAQHVHESSLRERCKDCPTTAVDLIETFLSIEPEKRGTASSALLSQYFNTMPYACDPSSLPKYTPNKEMDANIEKKQGGKLLVLEQEIEIEAPRKPRKANRTLQERNSNNKFAPKEEVKENTQFVRKINDSNAQMDKGREVVNRELNSTFDTTSETSQATKGDYVFSGPAPVIASSGFAWAKRRKEDVASTLSYNQDISMSEISALYSSSFNFANSSFNLAKEEDERHDSQEATAKHVVQKQRRRFGSSDSFDASNLYHFNDSKATDEADALTSYPNYLKRRENIEFSGPLLSQSNKIDELLQRNESQIRQAARRSRLDREVDYNKKKLHEELLLSLLTKTKDFWSKVATVLPKSSSAIPVRWSKEKNSSGPRDVLAGFGGGLSASKAFFPSVHEEGSGCLKPGGMEE